MSAMQARALTALHKLYLQFCKACYSKDMADAHQSKLNVKMPPPSAFQASWSVPACSTAELFCHCAGSMPEARTPAYGSQSLPAAVAIHAVGSGPQAVPATLQARHMQEKVDPLTKPSMTAMMSRLRELQRASRATSPMWLVAAPAVQVQAGHCCLPASELQFLGVLPGSLAGVQLQWLEE